MKAGRRYFGLETSLWALNRRLAVGAFRSLGRRTPTVSGLYLIALIVGVGLLAAWDHGLVARNLGKMFFLFSPTILTCVTLFAVRSGLTGTAFFFTSAETSFLLTAPLNHAQLVRYKLYQMALLLLVVSLVGSVCMVSVPSMLQVFEKVYLLLLFFQLMPVLLTSFVRNEQSPILVALRLFLDLLFGLLLVSMAAAMYLRVLARWELSSFCASIFATLTSPFSALDVYLWHNNPLVSAKIVRGLFFTDALLVAGVWWRSRHLKIESLLYKNGRRKRAGRRDWFRAAFPARASAKPARTAAPELWGGLGALLWRKGHECQRNLKSILLLTLLMILGFSAILLFFLKINSLDPRKPLFFPWHFLFCAECFTLLALLFARFSDFRADGDKMEILLTLPVSAGKLLVGELLPSLAYVMFLLMLLLGLGGSLFARTSAGTGIGLFVGLALATVPIRALLYVFATNLIALLFPVPRVASERTVVAIATQFFAEFLGMGMLARLLFALESWAYGATLNQPAMFLRYFLLSGLPILAVVLLLAWALAFSVRRFNPAKLAIA